MQEVPHITVSRGDVVVDSVTFRPGILGFVGRPQWRIGWRSTENPTKLNYLIIDRDCTVGSSELEGVPFSFVVHWRGDMRRSISDRTQINDSTHASVVCPGSVLQLAESIHR